MKTSPMNVRGLARGDELDGKKSIRASFFVRTLSYAGISADTVLPVIFILPV
jgi:hypothetical protein